MKVYARVQDGIVMEIIEPRTFEATVTVAVGLDGEPVGPAPKYRDGDEVAIEDRYHPDIVATLVEVPEGKAVAQRWTYVDGEFAPPGGEGG